MCKAISSRANHRCLSLFSLLLSAYVYRTTLRQVSRTVALPVLYMLLLRTNYLTHNLVGRALSHLRSVSLGCLRLSVALLQPATLSGSWARFAFALRISICHTLQWMCAFGCFSYDLTSLSFASITLFFLFSCCKLVLRKILYSQRSLLRILLYFIHCISVFFFSLSITRSI